MMNLEAPWVGHSPYEDDEEQSYYCPECHRECSTLYIKDDDIIGCENCISICSTEDWEDWDE